MGKIYTIGYGNRSPAEFLAVLKDAEIELVIDVRSRPGAWLSCYRAGDSGMCDLLVDHAPLDEGIVYLWSPELGKPKEMLLEDYPAEVLDTDLGQKHLWLAEWWIRRSGRTCLLCAELHAYKDGEVNCHRWYVAEALVERLGDGWNVAHL